MTDIDHTPNDSPLAQSVTRDGKTIQVEIYDDGEGRWLLEAVDEYGNSTIWDETFKSDRDALDEVLNTIEQEGIDSLIGSPPDWQGTAALNRTLSNAELAELDDFLADEALEETSMDVSTLDGFLTAITIGQTLVLPSEWLPWVWDMYSAEAVPEFASEEQANRIMSLVMRLYNAVIHASNADPAAFAPVFRRGDQWGAAEWCEGFMLGFQFNKTAWSVLAVAQPTWLTPFLRLGTDAGVELTGNANDAETWLAEIEPSLVSIHAYWKEQRSNRQPGLFIDDLYPRGHKVIETVVRGGPKIGRNDPCPCGSGKKFKKCCGADGAPPSLH